MYISTVPNFIPTGWDENVYNDKYLNTPGYTSGSWTAVPNILAEWNGVDKNLHSTYAVSPMNVTNLIVGKTYYYKIVIIDKAGQRSVPSAEQTAIISPDASSYSWVENFIQSPYDSSIWSSCTYPGTSFNSIHPTGTEITLNTNGAIIMDSKSVNASIVEASFVCTLPQINPSASIRLKINILSYSPYDAYFNFRNDGQNSISCCTDRSDDDTPINVQYGVEHVFKIVINFKSHQALFYVDGVLVATHIIATGANIYPVWVALEADNTATTTPYTMTFKSISCIYYP
jgi:hypothetical protein